MKKIFSEIIEERCKQDLKWGEQNHSPIEWIAILGEEFGEVSKEALEFRFQGKEDSLINYRKEIIQVAAVAVAMIECLERGKW